MDNFQDVIKEDIKELINEMPCFFCGNDILFKNLGGIKHAIGNILELENPVCLSCWNAKENQLVAKVFSPLDDILEQSQGSLTEIVKLVSTVPSGEEATGVAQEEIPDIPGVEKSHQWKPEPRRDCSHEYKILGGSKLECRLCYKRFTLMED